MSNDLYERFLEISKEEFEVVPNNSLGSVISVKVTSYEERKFEKRAQADVELFKLEEEINNR